MASPHMVAAVPPGASAGFGQASLLGRLLDGLVLEVDASTTGGEAACWIGARHVAHKNSPVAYVVTQWTEQDEELLGTKREDPAHQAT